MTPWPLGVLAPDTSYAVAAPSKGERPERTGGGERPAPTSPAGEQSAKGRKRQGRTHRRPRSPTWGHWGGVVGENLPNRDTGAHTGTATHSAAGRERGELGSYGVTVTTRPLSGPLPMSSHHASFAKPGCAWAGTRIRIADALD